MGNQDLKNIFPLISFEELEGEQWQKYYHKLVISCFDKVLCLEEYKSVYMGLISKFGKESLYFRFYSMFLDFAGKKNSCYFVKVNEYTHKGEEVISLEEINLLNEKTKIVSYLVNEKYFKLVFPSYGIIFESAHDLSAVIYLNYKIVDFNVVKNIISQSDLNLIGGNNNEIGCN